MVTLFRVDPYLIRIVSGSSINTSDPGKSKNVILDNKIKGSSIWKYLVIVYYSP